MGCPEESTKKAAALFILTFQERYKLSQKAINLAVGTVDAIVDSACEAIHSSLQERYPASDIAECFDNRESPFADLDTEYMQSKYYKQEFGLVVCHVFLQYFACKLDIMPS